MNDVELLRKAATLMRERAEAATRGRWESEEETVKVVGETRYVCDAFGLADKWPNAEHIASWDPTVALAVADLLDHAAVRLGNILPRWSEEWNGDEVVVAALVDGVFRHPLAIARTYLDEATS